MSRENAPPGQIAATRIALNEIAEILEAYPKAVIVGGTVPYLLVPQKREPHEGTVDIDIVLDLDQPGADPILTLHEVLERRLFQQDETRPFRYTKGVPVEGEYYKVLIELLGGGTPPAGGMRHIRTEDVYVSIIKGIEVALDNPVEVSLPDNFEHTISVASIPAFFAMKAVALESREELEKTIDAYDIVYCLRNYEGGVQAIANEYRKVHANPLVAAGLELLGALFNSTEAVGPVSLAKGAQDADEAALLAREAYERVQELLQALDSKLV